MWFHSISRQLCTWCGDPDAESPVDIGSMRTARVQCCHSFKSITMRRYFLVRFFEITFVELMIT